MIYVIIDAIFTILLLVPFIWFGISGVTIDLISIYYSVCTFSLYKKLEMESINGVGQYQLTTITTAYQQPQVIGYQQPQMIGYQQPQVQAPFEYPQVPDYQKPQNLPNESN